MVFADDIALGDFTSVDLDDLVAKDYYSGRGQRAAKTFFLALGLGFGPVGVFWAVFASDILTGIVGFLVFRRGKWKGRIV